MSKKTRLDVLLVERGLIESRQKAQAVIMSGEVFVKGQRVDKPGTAVDQEAEIEVRGNSLRYVSRGGLKLEKAMATFPVHLKDAVALPIWMPAGRNWRPSNRQMIPGFCWSRSSSRQRRRCCPLVPN